MSEREERQQYEIEVILLRQIASYLAMPIFIVDNDGNLVFYNEPAEEILGRRYDETGEMPVEEWATVFTPTDQDGRELSPEELPLVTAIRHRRPAHGGFWITGLDGSRRRLSVTGLPIVGQGGRDLGSLAIFWEEERVGGDGAS